ncbi:hypothetical protein A4G19_02390 [Pasteurellaceae bacterium Macca]|nr:hypothetical protein [Pasteurellaceae bacterium Macca]
MNQTINDFSLLCRLFGNLFYRSPTDPILGGTFEWLKQGNLQQTWALSTDSQSDNALAILAQQANPVELQPHYERLFAKSGEISTACSDYGISADEFQVFRQQRGMPVVENVDHVALLLLSASWIEDNLDSTALQQTFFEHFVLPCLGKFLGKVEAFDSGFYKALAQLTRDALSAMADELEEESESTE